MRDVFLAYLASFVAEVDFDKGCRDSLLEAGDSHDGVSAEDLEASADDVAGDVTVGLLEDVFGGGAGPLEGAADPLDRAGFFGAEEVIQRTGTDRR